MREDEAEREAEEVGPLGRDLGRWVLADRGAPHLNSRGELPGDSFGERRVELRGNDEFGRGANCRGRTCEGIECNGEPLC